MKIIHPIQHRNLQQHCYIVCNVAAILLEQSVLYRMQYKAYNNIIATLLQCYCNIAEKLQCYCELLHRLFQQYYSNIANASFALQAFVLHAKYLALQQF